MHAGLVLALHWSKLQRNAPRLVSVSTGENWLMEPVVRVFNPFSYTPKPVRHISVFYVMMFEFLLKLILNNVIALCPCFRCYMSKRIGFQRMSWQAGLLLLQRVCKVYKRQTTFTHYSLNPKCFPLWGFSLFLSLLVWLYRKLHRGAFLENSREGCFCPNGLFRAGNHSDICVADCPCE